jgi:arabinose-5-phosphate isomerase
MNKRFEQIIYNLKFSLESINFSKLNELISDCIFTINNNGKIISSGIGKNVPICEKFDGTLKSLGIPSLFINSNTALHGDLGSINKNDLVIVLSKSANSNEILNFYNHLLLRGCRIWFITFNKKLLFNNSHTKILFINLIHESDLWNIMPINSSTINLIVLHEIAIQLSKKLKIKLAEFKFNHPGGNIGLLLNSKNNKI